MPTVITVLAKLLRQQPFIFAYCASLYAKIFVYDGPFRWQDDPETVGMTVERLPLRVIQSAIDGI